MNLSDLLKEGRVREVEPDAKQAEECLGAARRDLSVAKKILDEDYDWAFSISYNAMLQSARALMFAQGYRSVGENSHKTVVDFIDVKLGAKYSNKVDLFDDMRRKRHRVIYEKAGVVSRYEAEHAIKTAEEFVKQIDEKMKTCR